MISRGFTHLFADTTRARGAQYFADGRVDLISVTKAGAKALVRGSRLYDVEVLPGPKGDLKVLCDCPFFDDHDHCKHIWATLLAIDEEGPGGMLPGYTPPDQDGLALRRRQRLELSHPRARERQPRPKAPSRPPEPPEWARTLQSASTLMQRLAWQAPAAGGSATWPADKRINYIIDLSRCQMSRALVAELATQTRDKQGGWKAPKRFGYSGAQWLAAPDPIDHEIATRLTATHSEWIAPNSTPGGGFVISRSAYEPVLRLMCETGCCRLRRHQHDKELKTLTWDGGAPWDIHLRLAPDKDGVSASGVLRRAGHADLALSDVLVLEAGLVIAGDSIAEVRDSDSYPLVAMLANRPLHVPRKDVPAFLRSLYTLPHLPPVDAAAELGLHESRPVPVPRVAITVQPPPAWLSQARAPVDLTFDYDGVSLPLAPGSPPFFDPDTLRVVHRHPDAEREAVDLLNQLGARWMHDYNQNRKSLHFPLSRVDAAIESLSKAGWHVEIAGRRVRHAESFDVGVTSGIDWFDLQASVDFEGVSVTLPQLLAGLRAGGAGVALPDGSVGMIPASWRERWETLAGFGTIADDGLRFTRSQVGLLDALLATIPEARADQAFERARARLREFERVQPAAEPPGFAGELRPYQREGLGWFDFLRDFGFGGCLADDMGLGKTIQVLALLEARRQAGAGPSLVVVPRSLITNWMREAARFTPALRLIDHSGAGRSRGKPELRSFDLMLTTYGVLRREAAALRDVEFEYVILDEAQAIKNAGTASAKAARLLRGRHRLVLSGTPIENRLADLWSLFDFLNPGMLGTGLLKTLTNGSGNGQQASRELLARALKPFILRRTKTQVAPELPERLEQTLYIDLEPDQRKLYDELRDHYRDALLGRIDRVGVKRSRIQILEALLRLRQAACHPGLLDAKRAGDGGGKLEVLQARLEEAAGEGHKALVFSQFTSFLALLRTRLDAAGVTYEYLDGRTRDRQQRVDRFQTDTACPVFLISLKAGGLGLNLTAAEYVFLMDPWWNPAVEAQAIDRAHRIGQTRRVFATRLIARDTVEEKVLELQQAKRDLADAIITADNSVIAKIEREDLEFLLS